MFDGSNKISDKSVIRSTKSKLDQLNEMIARPAISFMAEIMRNMLRQQYIRDGITDDAVISSEIMKKCENLKRVELEQLKHELGFDKIENPNLDHEEKVQKLIEQAKKINQVG